MTIHAVVMFNSNIFSLQGVWGKKKRTALIFDRSLRNGFQLH